ncbi:hypothetical protein GPALN_010641 [Globodera pallida]|nr:hypothetical protein GPALN_010641 [Globodera pallida]
MYRRRASFVHHRHCSPPMRSAGGRSARHSPPAAFRHANNDFRSTGPPSSTFRSRPPRGFAPFRVRAFCHHNRFRAVAPAPSVRAGFRGRFAPPRAVLRGRPAPPRIPYHCRADISPRRSPCRSRSRSADTPPPPPPTAATVAQHSSLRRSPSWSPPPPLAAERGGRGGRNRSGFRGGGRFVAGRSKFIGNYGRPINHPPSYEVSPDRTAPGASAGDDEIAAVQPAAEVQSNRDELYTKMMEAKKSENLDDYYRLRDTLNAFDVRNPHLAFRGSGATSAAVARKRSRSAGEKAAEPTAVRKRKRGHDDDGEDDHRHQHRHHERKSMTAPKKKRKHEEDGAPAGGGGGGGTTTSSAVGTADELEEVDSIDARYEQDKCNAKYVQGNAGGGGCGDKRRKSVHERSTKQLKKRHSADTNKSSSDTKCHRLQIALDSDAEKSPEKCVSSVVAANSTGRRRLWTKAHDERNGEDDGNEQQAWLDELDDEEEEVGFDLVENEQLDNNDEGDGGTLVPLPSAEKLDDDNVTTASRDALQEVEEFAEVPDEDDDGEGGGGGEGDYDAQSYGELFRPDFVTILQSSVAKGLRMRKRNTTSSSSSSNRRHHQQVGGATNGRQQQQNADANGTDEAGTGNGNGGTASVGQQQQQPCTLVEMALARLVANTVEEIESSEA